MNVILQADGLVKIREVDKKLMSYNIEMAEVTGGNFWKEFTSEQIEGIEEFPSMEDWSKMGDLLQSFPPIDLYDEKLRKLAKALGPVWIRVSGGWANKVYYDLDGKMNGRIPVGFESVLTEKQWKGVLDFAREVDAKLLVSVSNTEGIHKAKEPWHPNQARVLFEYSKNYGVPISAVEFCNEPNLMQFFGFVDDYTAEDFGRDQNIFLEWIRNEYPEVLVVGPATAGDSESGTKESGGIGATKGLKEISVRALMENAKESLDIYSFHCYNGVSERAALMGGHWPADTTMSEEYLAVAPNAVICNMPARDKYTSSGKIWVTESADGGCGGNTWASTYLDVFRTANELGAFARLTDGVIFHNTLASSDYGFLKRQTYEPRPNYWFVLLWNRIMGTTVYDTKIEICEGAHVYAHSRRDGKDGLAYLVINNSQTKETVFTLQKEASVYRLSCDKLRGTIMQLNGRKLMLKENGELPELEPIILGAGKITLAPTEIAFIVL